RNVPLLEVRALQRSFYGVRALDGVDLVVEAGTITGLIGPNGAGKTTLFHCVSGLIPPEGGRVLFDGRDVTGWRADRVTQAGLVRTFQIAGVNPTLASEIAEHLHALRAEGMTFLIIEHHLDLIARLCRPVIVMAEGRHLAEGAFAEIAGDPRVQEAYMGRRRWAS